MARKNDRNGKSPETSAISAHQKRLAEEDARIKAEEARLHRMLEAAPKKRASVGGLGPADQTPLWSTAKAARRVAETVLAAL